MEWAGTEDGLKGSEIEGYHITIQRSIVFDVIKMESLTLNGFRDLKSLGSKFTSNGYRCRFRASDQACRALRRRY
jgi:hypothetical protein